MGFCLIFIGIIVHSCSATGDIYALDSVAIYDGLLSPENIIGTNLQVKNSLILDVLTIFSFQNLINFVASVVGWALLVPLWQPQERVCMDRPI